MTKRLDGKVALITGGAGGFGQAIAKAFLHEGAQVVLTDVNSKAIAAAAQDNGCIGLVHNVSDEEEWKAIVAEVEGRFGKFNVLVNNAGILGDLDHGSPEQTELSDFHRVIAINTVGAFLGCKYAIPAMRRAGGGSIINMSSIAAMKATWFETAYGVSKAGVKQLTMSVAQHVAKENIRCNAVHPGQMKTAMSKSAMDTMAPKFGVPSGEALEEMFVNYVPMGKFGNAEDIAMATLFLASDESTYITGTSLMVDGGMSIT
ncbi:SDR family NAD(P)-dependent oxidoreductase [Agrobacterium sp. LAD9]|uniref:SDR family NAD(P)-dependent oxidoreductase n=1 Tax=Agrobacterium sp. LAD9 TaxID=2055153 RepID=UPI000D1E4463|nr:SDR family oxidoreductase [Agrobacterium sp. LAD9]